MTAETAVALIDAELEASPSTRTMEHLLSLLQKVRSALVDRPEWSEVTEGNLRAEMAVQQQEHEQFVAQCEMAAGIFQAALERERGRTESARRWAVRFEAALSRAEGARL